jgi:hypothetical protein
MKITLVAKNSAGHDHRVTVELVDGLFSMNCDCIGGVQGLLCDHRVGILSGKLSSLSGPHDLDSFRSVGDWLNGSNAEKMFNEMLNSLRRVDADKQALDKEAEQIMTLFAQKLGRGI